MRSHGVDCGDLDPHHIGLIVPRKPSREYPIRAVALMTGLSLDTLRAWERRYEAVVPRRGERGRVYSDADITRLRQLGELVARGHSIGTIARQSNAQLADLLESSNLLSNAPTPDRTVARLDEVTTALDRYDLATVERELNRFAAVLPPRELIFGVVLPLLTDIGARWEAGTLRPAQEHMVSAIVRSVLGGLLRVLSRVDASPRVVLATPSGERHELGLLCGAVLSAAAGLGVVYLGCDLPATEILHAAERSDARIVLISLTTPGAVTRAELRALAATPPTVSLWVGGPAASQLMPLLDGRARHVETLSDAATLLEHHAR
jgi:DNA-binding transcriptional MerR regulator/methylmalonyl-CoA mutase cobalamin-binding subunit